MSTRSHEILEEVSVDVRLRIRFMHDGAPARQFLNRHFANKRIGRGGPIAWPARSPGFEFIRFSSVGTFKIYRTRNID